MYIIWSFEHKAYWKPNSFGYTADISKAGLYTKDEATKICEDANKYSLEEEMRCVI